MPLGFFQPVSGPGGAVGGSGTLNKIAKWTPDGFNIGNSQFFDNGTNVGLNTLIPDPASIFDIVSTATGILIPRMSTATAMTIPLPPPGLTIWNTDISDFETFVPGTPGSFHSLGGRSVLIQNAGGIPPGETLKVRAGERAITFGSFPSLAGLVVDPGGAFFNIDGGDRTVPVFDSSLIMSASSVKIEANGRINVPVFTSIPSSTAGDIFITDIAGTRLLNVNIGGFVKSVEIS